MTLTTPVCGLSSSASLTARYPLSVITHAIIAPMSQSTDIELLHRAWEAMSGARDLSVLEGALDPEAQWLGVEDGQICENRKMILKVMERNLHGGLVGRIEETVEVGGRIVLASVPISPETTDGRWIRASPTSLSRCATGA